MDLLFAHYVLQVSTPLRGLLTAVNVWRGRTLQLALLIALYALLGFTL